MRRAIAFLFAGLIAAVVFTAETPSAGQTIPPNLHLPLVRFDATFTPTVTPVPTETPTEIPTVTPTETTTPVPTEHVIPPLIDVMVRGSDIPQGWAVDTDSYLSVSPPILLASYEASYWPTHSDLFFWGTIGITLDTPEHAQQRIDGACQSAVDDGYREIVWNQVGDRSCARLGEYGIGIMFASFGALGISIISTDLIEPDWSFYEGCIRLMAQRAGFSTDGACNLHRYDTIVASDGNWVTPDSSLYEDLQKAFAYLK